MAETMRRYMDGPFGQMHVRIGGEATARPPLLCFHMSPMSSRTFARFVAEMGEDRLAVAVDTPGFGMSDPPPTPPSIADYARAMAAVANELRLAGPVDLMGYPTGSMIACELAASGVRPVRRLVLIAAPIFTEEERGALRAHYGPAAPPTADGAHLLRIWKGFHHHMSAGGMAVEQIADAFPERLLGRADEWWGHAAAFSFALDLRLPEIAQPILVLNPNDDLQVETRRAAPLIRDGQIVELPDWGHGFLDLHTAAAARIVRDFLDD